MQGTIDTVGPVINEIPQYQGQVVKRGDDRLTLRTYLNNKLTKNLFTPTTGLAVFNMALGAGIVFLYVLVISGYYWGDLYGANWRRYEMIVVTSFFVLDLLVTWPTDGCMDRTIVNIAPRAHKLKARSQHLELFLVFLVFAIANYAFAVTPVTKTMLIYARYIRICVVKGLAGASLFESGLSFTRDAYSQPSSVEWILIAEGYANRPQKPRSAEDIY